MLHYEMSLLFRCHIKLICCPLVVVPYRQFALIASSLPFPTHNCPVPVLPGVEQD